MKRFEWQVIVDKGRRGVKIYQARHDDLNALVFVREGGTNTAVATIEQDNFYAKRICRGRNANRQAKAWCNWWLNNTPSYISMTSYAPRGS